MAVDTATWIVWLILSIILGVCTIQTVSRSRDKQRIWANFLMLVVFSAIVASALFMNAMPEAVTQ